MLRWHADRRGLVSGPAANDGRADVAQRVPQRRDHAAGGTVKDIANLKAEIDGLKARQKAVEDLQTNRNIPVYLLDELVKYTPEGIYLTSIKQAGDQVTIAGVAQTNERVELLRNTQNQSKWLHKPELVEIKAISLAPAAGSREQRRLFDEGVADPAAARATRSRLAGGACFGAGLCAGQEHLTGGVAMANTTSPANLDQFGRFSQQVCSSRA